MDFLNFTLSSVDLTAILPEAVVLYAFRAADLINKRSVTEVGAQ